jgi:hypothetical protein
MINEKGDLIDFSDREKFLLYDVSGLGVEFDNKVDIFNASVLMNSQSLKLGSLKATLLVGQNSSNGYEIFTEIFRFLNSPPYTMLYETDNGVYYRSCVLNKLTKSDMKKGRIFLEDIIFDFLTPFYKEISETYKPNSDTEGDGKIYAGSNRPRNLIANPNFLNNMESWDNMSDPEGTYQLQAPTSDKPNSNILKLTSSNNKLSSFINAWGLKVRKGERLSFRVDIKTENNPDYDRPVIRVGYGTGEKNYKYSDFGITASSSDFETTAISFIVPEDGVFQLYLINQNLSTMSEMSTYFREPMLIRGDAENLPVDQYDDSYPNLNLLDGTRGFSGYWGNTAGWYDDGLYGGLNVKSFNGQWNGIYKAYTITTDGDYTFSAFVKSDNSTSEIHRYVLINGQYVSDTILGNQFDWKKDGYTFSGLNAGDVVFVKYENAIYNSQKISVAGYKIEYGPLSTPWMPSSSEVTNADYPSFEPGFYSGKPSKNYYVYPYVYESDYNGKSGVFQIENNSVYIGSAKGSPVEITVHGPCTNPYWEILDGSDVLQSDGYNLDVPEGYKLVVSSIVQNQRMKLIAPDGTISNVYQQQDLSKSNFVTIPEGRTTLAFHNVGDVSFKYREEYITV